MVNMTIAIPDELHKLMRKHQQIKWSQVARDSIATTAQKLEWMDKVLAKSKLTKADTIHLGRKVKKDMLVEYKKEGWL